MTAVLLALGSAALFGGMTVALRLGAPRLAERERRDARDGRRRRSASRSSRRSCATTCTARGRSSSRGCSPRAARRSLFTLAVREIGASRTSVAVGAAPLVAVAIALVFLDEPLRLPLVVGALAIVAGGVLLAAERDRPGHLRARGLLFAAGAATMFATRDNLVRALHATPRRRPRPPRRCSPARSSRRSGRGGRRRGSSCARFAPAGVMFGLSYVLLFEAYWRGRVSVVSPLVATESLWGVALSALLIRHTEGMGRRLALGALLVVVGGAVIGAAR